jgi:hypothetical protein
VNTDISPRTNPPPGSRFPRAVLFCAVIAATLAILWHPLNVRIAGILDIYCLNGDAYQHIAPMWFSRQPIEAVNDYTMRYYLTAIFPPFFKWTYSALTIWATPALAAKLVTVTLSLAFIGLSTASAFQLSGTAAACFSFFLATAGVVKNMFFMGGIQRGFGFFLTSLALYLVIQGRLAALAVVAVLAAGFYPAAAIFLLLTLGVLYLLPQRLRGELHSWGLKARLATLVSAGILASIVVIPLMLHGREYGERLSLEAQSEFAEWGVGGRYNQGDRGVPANLARKSFFTLIASLSAHRLDRSFTREIDTGSLDLARDIPPAIQPVLVLILTALLAGFTLARSSWKLSPATARCSIFTLMVFVSFFLAKALFPILYIPSRYLALGIVCLVPVVFPAIWGTAINKLTRGSSVTTRSLIAAVFGSIVFTYLGWTSLQVKRFSSVAGHRALFNFIKSLPDNTVIASWPRSVANNITLFSGKPVLVFEEGHQIFHRDFLEEMRRRTRAIIAAYSATDAGPFIELNKKYNVSHFLLQRTYLREAPDYFAPFGEESKAARQALGDRPLFFSELIEKRAVFRAGDQVLLDIRDLE